MADKSSEFWGILELMGHVRLAGRISEEEKFGGKLGRIDIPRPSLKDCPACKGQLLTDGSECPVEGCGGFTTQFFNASSIYRLTPTTEEVARHVAVNCQPSPVHAWELPRPAIGHVDVSRADTDDGY